MENLFTTHLTYCVICAFDRISKTELKLIWPTFLNGQSEPMSIYSTSVRKYFNSTWIDSTMSNIECRVALTRALVVHSTARPSETHDYVKMYSNLKFNTFKFMSKQNLHVFSFWQMKHIKMFICYKYYWSFMW